jgi:excinuclease UvrABC nuclease subunit
MSNWIRIDPLKTFEDESPYSSVIPRCPGCYVIYCDGKPVYVGQTTNLNKRFKSYEINYAPFSTQIVPPWCRCDSLFIKIRPSKRYGDWAMIELRLIKKLQPIYNCAGSVRERKTNAKR